MSDTFTDWHYTSHFYSSPLFEEGDGVKGNYLHGYGFGMTGRTDGNGFGEGADEGYGLGQQGYFDGNGEGNDIYDFDSVVIPADEFEAIVFYAATKCSPTQGENDEDA